MGSTVQMFESTIMSSRVVPLYQVPMSSAPPEPTTEEPSLLSELSEHSPEEALARSTSPEGPQEYEIAASTGDEGVRDVNTQTDASEHLRELVAESSEVLPTQGSSDGHAVEIRNEDHRTESVESAERAAPSTADYELHGAVNDNTIRTGPVDGSPALGHFCNLDDSNSAALGFSEETEPSSPSSSQDIIAQSQVHEVPGLGNGGAFWESQDVEDEEAARAAVFEAGAMSTEDIPIVVKRSPSNNMNVDNDVDGADGDLNFAARLGADTRAPEGLSSTDGQGDDTTLAEQVPKRELDSAMMDMSAAVSATASSMSNAGPSNIESVTSSRKRTRETSTPQSPPPPPPPPPKREYLHTFSCPICFSPPSNATLTPCGHILCGECLFTAVGAATHRTGIGGLGARCPVCRALLPGWDGKGGGVIGLKPKTLTTLG